MIKLIVNPAKVVCCTSAYECFYSTFGKIKWAVTENYEKIEIKPMLVNMNLEIQGNTLLKYCSYLKRRFSEF